MNRASKLTDRNSRLVVTRGEGEREKNAKKNKINKIKNLKRIVPMEYYTIVKMNEL